MNLRGHCICCVSFHNVRVAHEIPEFAGFPEMRRYLLMYVGHISGIYYLAKVSSYLVLPRVNIIPGSSPMCGEMQ